MKTLCLAVLAVSAAVPQVQEPSVFRSTTRLIQVNVVVHGKHGPIGDLKPEDFTLFEEGKPQRIAFFSAENAATLTNPGLKLPENVFSNRFGEQRQSPHSVTVILLDTLNTAWADQVVMRHQVLRFLKQIQPHQRVALYTMGRGLRVLHDYTSDASSLIERLNRWTADRDNVAISKAMEAANDPLDELLPLEVAEAEQDLSDSIQRARIVDTLRTLEAVAEHLAAVPGRKSLIWVSGGIPLKIGFDHLNPGASRRRHKETFYQQAEQAMRALNLANVAIYPVDARGLATDPRFQASIRPLPRTQVWSPPHLDTVNLLARRTGGKAYYNRNDIDGAVGEVFADGQISYTLGFYPAAADSSGKFRNIHVKVNRPGVSLRYREGYFAFGDLNPNDSKSIQVEMSNAAWSPLDATAIPLNARVDLIKEQGAYNVVLRIDAGALTLNQVGSRWRGRLDFVFVQKAEDGRQLAGVSDVLKLNMTATTHKRVCNEGLVFHRKIPAQADARVLRIVVRDAPSGLAGSLTIPLNTVVPFTPEK